MGFIFGWRKKPVEIEAMRYDGTIVSADEVIEWASQHEHTIAKRTNELHGFDLVVPTLEGDMEIASGDWVIKGVKGEFYPCKPDIFDLTYDPVMRRCDVAACNCGSVHQVSSSV